MEETEQIEKEPNSPSESKSSLELKILGYNAATGHPITPSTVRAGDLAELITNFEDAVISLAVDAGSLDLDDLKDEAEISLVRIGEGSNLLGLAVSPSVQPSASRILTALNDRNFDNIPIHSHRCLKKIFKQTQKTGWSLEFKGDRNFDFIVASISSKNPIPEIKQHTAKGGTNIYGKLMRIGNNKPTAMVKLPDKTTISVEMTRRMVKELEARHKLYDVVGFEGDATWVVEGWKIVDFFATRIIGYHAEGGNLTSMFDRLAESSAGSWNDIDPVEYVNELRGR